MQKKEFHSKIEGWHEVTGCLKKQTKKTVYTAFLV